MVSKSDQPDIGPRFLSALPLRIAFWPLDCPTSRNILNGRDAFCSCRVRSDTVTKFDSRSDPGFTDSMKIADDYSCPSRSID